MQPYAFNMKRPETPPLALVDEASRDSVTNANLNSAKKKRDTTHMRVREARLRLSRHRRRAHKIARNF
jgi:hypothetical protein